MNSKFIFLKLFLVLFLLTACGKSENVYTELLDKELQDSNSFLQDEIIQQDFFIKLKVGDYPYLKPSYDSLTNIKTKIDSFRLLPKIYQKDSSTITKIKKLIEKESKQSFDFNSLNVKSNIKDSLFLKIIKLDLLKIKYMLNKRFISEHCNVVQ